MSTDLVSPRPYPSTPLKMSCFGWENNSLKSWIESPPPSKLRLRYFQCSIKQVHFFYLSSVIIVEIVEHFRRRAQFAPKSMVNTGKVRERSVNSCAYCLSKKSRPNLHSKLLYKMGQDFLDIQYLTAPRRPNHRLDCMFIIH